jgi:hypothetical protein
MSGGLITTATHLSRVSKGIWALMEKHPVIGPILAKGERTGVMMAFAPIANPKGKHIFQVAQPNRKKRQNYEFHAGEKLDRTAAHPDHVASYESRNEEKMQFSGCVRGRDYFWSISGLWPDALDEFMATLVGLAAGDFSKRGAMGLLIRTKNEYQQYFADFKVDEL